MIYVHIVALGSLMLHAKFQDPRPLGSGGEDFYHGHDGHLGLVTWIIYVYFGSCILRMLHMKFGFD